MAEWLEKLPGTFLCCFVRVLRWDLSYGPTTESSTTSNAHAAYSRGRRVFDTTFRRAPIRDTTVCLSVPRTDQIRSKVPDLTVPTLLISSANKRWAQKRLQRGATGTNQNAFFIISYLIPFPFEHPAVIIAVQTEIFAMPLDLGAQLSHR